MSISIEEFGKLQKVIPHIKKTEEEKKEQMRVYHKQLYLENKEEALENASKYYQEHKEERQAYAKQRLHRHFTLGSFREDGFRIQLIQSVGTDSKVLGIGHFTGIRTPEEQRRSVLAGATTLNEWFPGCEAHHMSEDVVIFIPKELHRSIRHNLETGDNMDLINGKALVWAGRQSNG